MGLGFTCARALPQTCKPSQRPDILPEAKSCFKHKDLRDFDTIWRTDDAQNVSEALKCVFRLLRKPKNPRQSSVFTSFSMTLTKNHTFVFSSVWSEMTKTTHGFQKFCEAPQTRKHSQSPDILPKAKRCSKR